MKRFLFNHCLTGCLPSSRHREAIHYLVIRRKLASVRSPRRAADTRVATAICGARTVSFFKALAFVFLFSTLFTTTYAQQQAMYTQYMFNGLALNPAYAGSHGALSLTGLARVQWTGIEGAPNTQTFSMHSPIADRSSLGLFLIHDNIGVTNQYGFYGSYAYRIPTGEKSSLSMGLQVGFNNYNIDLNQITTKNPDPNFAVNGAGGLLPNFGAGLFYSSERFYIGASVPHILTNDLVGDDVNSAEARQFRHYFVTAGYVFDLGPSLKLKPNFLVKAVQGAPVAYDINANLLIKEVLWVGFSYRPEDAISGLIEMLLTPQLRLGYAYDYTTSELQSFSQGSHELMLNFRFAFDKSNVLSPRYF